MIAVMQAQSLIDSSRLQFVLPTGNISNELTLNQDAFTILKREIDNYYSFILSQGRSFAAISPTRHQDFPFAYNPITHDKTLYTGNQASFFKGYKDLTTADAGHMNKAIRLLILEI